MFRPLRYPPPFSSRRSRRPQPERFSTDDDILTALIGGAE
jgi:hypothetical protein